MRLTEGSQHSLSAATEPLLQLLDHLQVGIRAARPRCVAERLDAALNQGLADFLREIELHLRFDRDLARSADSSTQRQGVLAQAGAAASLGISSFHLSVAS
jgi:hypothetical protein